jgi:hypothetical protein
MSNPNAPNKIPDAGANYDDDWQPEAGNIEPSADMDLPQAYDFLQKEYGSQSENGRQNGRTIDTDVINRARNGDSGASELVLQFVIEEKGSLARDYNEGDSETLQRINNLNAVEAAIKKRDQLDIDNARNEAAQQRGELLKNRAIGDARAEVAAAYPPDEDDFHNAAKALAARYGGMDWQKLIGGIDVSSLADKNPDKATAGYLMLENALNSNMSYDEFSRHWNGLMKEATDVDSSIPASVGSSDSR